MKEKGAVCEFVRVELAKRHGRGSAPRARQAVSPIFLHSTRAKKPLEFHSVQTFAPLALRFATGGRYPSALRLLPRKTIPAPPSSSPTTRFSTSSNATASSSRRLSIPPRPPRSTRTRPAKTWSTDGRPAPPFISPTRPNTAPTIAPAPIQSNLREGMAERLQQTWL